MPYRQLASKSERPLNADIQNLEQYLSGAEFDEIFGMSKAAFGKLAAWKQRRMKQERDLF